MNNNNALVAFIGSIIALDDIAAMRIACFNALRDIIAAAGLRRVTTNNNQSHDLRDADYEKMQGDILAGRKIQAIKDLRSITGWGLLDAKNAIEKTSNFHLPNGW